MAEEQRLTPAERLRHEVASWLSVIGALLCGLVDLLLIVYSVWISADRWIIELAKAHFAAMVGLPLAAAVRLEKALPFRRCFVRSYVVSPAVDPSMPHEGETTMRA